MTKGERIKELRKNAGFSQVDLANRIGVSKQTLYKYENDIITNIPSDKVELMAVILHTTPGYIMGWKVQNSGQDTDYYEDARLAQEMLEDPDMKSLFHMKKNMDEEKFQAHMRMMKDLYKLEHPEEEDFY